MRIVRWIRLVCCSVKENGIIITCKKIRRRVHNKFFYANEIKYEIKTELKSELKVELESELENELITVLKNELKPDLESELITMLKNELKSELENELSTILKGDEHINTESLASRKVPQIPLSPLVSRTMYLLNDLELPQDFVVMPTLDVRAFRVYKADEQRIFRYIPPEYAATCRELLKRMSDNQLLGTMFVNTWESDVIKATHPDALFLEQDYLQPTTLAYAWPPAMIWDYTLFMLEFIAALDKAGLRVIDPHSGNATFSNGRFVYYDIGSIDTGKTNIDSILILIESLINIAVLMACDQISRAYMYLQQGELVKFGDIKGHMSNNDIFIYEEMIFKTEDFVLAEDIATACEILKEYISHLQKPVFETRWSNYQKGRIDTFIKTGAGDLKFENAAELMRLIKPKTFIDLAGCGGLLSLMLQDEVEFSICADIDLSSINDLWSYMNEYGHKKPNIIPLRMNIASCSSVVPEHYPLKDFEVHWRKSRYRCECALALAVIHHLVLDMNLDDFDSVIKCFLQYTDKYLIVEYIDMEDAAIIQYWEEKHREWFTWYTKENFEKTLSIYCDILETRPSSQITRTLYLCEIKSHKEE